jgi:L-threonylcarbamoyladenylate synthase
VSLEPPSDAATIAAAARLLERGDLVAFPTETVYGLGADAENPAAVEKIYLAKGRPSNHPLIVHLSPEADVGYWSDAVGDAACRLMAAFWPGPLTLILSRAPHIPDTVAGGQQSIGLRCPSHPVAQALLREFKAGRGGIAAPSANRFGHVSPTLAQHVRDEFRDAPLLSCVLEGGQSEVGIESTIIDLSRGAPVLLRPGHVDSLQIAEVLGAVPGMPDDAAPRASGTLASHYAPHTPVAVVAADDIASTLAGLRAAGRRVALMHHTEVEDIGVESQLAGLAGRAALPAQPVGYAHDVYAALRRLDLCGADLILVEAIPDTAPWQAVGDRLKRAAHGSAGVLSRLL